MIIWTGRGWIGFVIIVGCLIGGGWLIDRAFGEGTFEGHMWPKLAAFLACSILCWVVGRPLNRDLPPRIFDLPQKAEDPATGATRIVEPKSHTLAFVRLEYAGLVAAPLYLFIAFEEAGLF